MLEKYYKDAITDAINSLKDDGVIILPTDTLYGLACLSSSKVAIERICEIKKRDKNKLLPLVVNSYKMLESISDVNLENVKKLSKFFPGSLTIVVNKKQDFDYFETKTIAVRMIDSPLINHIIELVNEPLCLTSANLSNKKNIDDPMELMEMFDGLIDCIFLGEKTNNVASTIVKICDNGKLELIREGKIPFNKILMEYEK